MRQKSVTPSSPSERLVKNIRRATRRHHSAEEKIGIVLDGLRGESSIAELCRREGIAEGLYYSWSKEFLEAGKRRLAGDTARAATSSEVTELRRQSRSLKEVVAEQALELRLLKKSMIADGETGNEISRRREAGDHSPGRAVTPAGTAHAGHAGDPAGDVLPVVRPRFQTGGPEALEDRSPRPRQVWNRIPDDVREQVVELALDEPELSPRELATRFTDTKRYFVSEASAYRLLKARDLIPSPAFIVIKAANEFKDKTTAPNQLWQTDFTYLKVIGWGWFYLSTILDDFSRYIISWKLCTTMKVEDVTDTLELALTASGCESAQVAHRPRLLSDNGSSYIAGDLAEWLEDRGIKHIRGAPFHPQTQGKIERWHQTLKNRVLLENYYLPGDLEAQINAFVDHYNHQRYHEAIANLTPADVYFGRGRTILLERERIKRQTIQSRRLNHRAIAA